MSDSFLLYSSPLELFFLTFVDILPFPFRVGRFGKKILLFISRKFCGETTWVGAFFLVSQIAPFCLRVWWERKTPSRRKKKKKNSKLYFYGERVWAEVSAVIPHAIAHIKYIRPFFSWIGISMNSHFSSSPLEQVTKSVSLSSWSLWGTQSEEDREIGFFPPPIVKVILDLKQAGPDLSFPPPLLLLLPLCPPGERHFNLRPRKLPKKKPPPPVSICLDHFFRHAQPNRHVQTSEGEQEKVIF